MNIVKVDEATRAFLASLPEETVFQDANGELVGLFKPGEVGRDELNRRFAPLFDDAECERRLAEGKPGLPLAEVWRRILERYPPAEQAEPAQ